MNEFGKVSTLLLLGLIGACGGAQREEVGQTTVTGGSYAPDAVELSSVQQKTSKACGTGLAPTIQFGPRTAALVPGEGDRLATWAACLNRPTLAHTTVVLVGGDEPGAPEGLFAARAGRIREGLVAQGVAPERIVDGTRSASREGGKLGPTSTMTLEVTSTDCVRFGAR